MPVVFALSMFAVGSYVGLRITGLVPKSIDCGREPYHCC